MEGPQKIRRIVEASVESSRLLDVRFNALSRIVVQPKPIANAPQVSYRKADCIVRPQSLFGVCIYSDQNRAMLKLIGELHDMEQQLRYVIIDRQSMFSARGVYCRIRPIDVRIGVPVSIEALEQRQRNRYVDSDEDLFDQPLYRVHTFSPTQPARRKERLCYKTDLNLPDSATLSCIWGGHGENLEIINVDLMKAGVHGHECATAFIIEAYSIPCFWVQQRFGKYKIWIEEKTLKENFLAKRNNIKPKKGSPNQDKVHWYAIKVVPQHNISGVPPFVESVYHAEDEYTLAEVTGRADEEEESRSTGVEPVNLATHLRLLYNHLTR